MTIDPSLLVGSLELDGQVALETRVRNFLQSGDRSELEIAAFKKGYEAAADVFIGSSKRIWSHGVSVQLGKPSTQIEPPPTRTEHRRVPEGWSITDTHAGYIRELIFKQSKSHERPTLIFDLDGTLVNVSYRTLGIFKKWLTNISPNRYPSDLVQRLAGINLLHIGYSLAHAFENAGLDLREEDVADAFESAETYWRRMFFDGKSLVEFDRKLPGAPEFVHSLIGAGINIVYLTGRSAKSMEKGTREQLRLLGFPIDQCRLFMKARSEESDHFFKEMTVRELSQSDQVIANFENEYINLHTMMAILPSECIHILVDTQHSGRPVPPNPEMIYRIRDYIMS